MSSMERFNDLDSCGRSSAGSSEETMDFDDGDDNSHPLLIGHVANDILSYMSYQDLRMCRLLSRKWDEEASRYLNEKVKVVLNSEDKVSSFIQEFENDRDFFKSVQIGPYMFMGSATIRRYFEMFGDHISALMLQKTNCTAADLKDILFRTAPNVKELTLYGMVPGKSRFMDIDDDMMHPTLDNIEVLNLNMMMIQGESPLRNFLTDLFQVTPNLRKIIVGKNEYKGFLRVFLSVLLGSQNVQLKHLNYVDTLFSFEDIQLQLLEARNFPLTAVNIQLMPSVTLGCLMSLLTSLGNTLNSLRLHFYLTQFKELPSFVPLPKLQQLSLEEYKGSLRFLSELPNVKELTVVMRSAEYLEESFPSDDIADTEDVWICDSLKRFRFMVQVPGACRPNCVDKMARSFPNLISLGMQGLGNESLRHIFESYPMLQELNVMPGMYSDEGITGISQEIIERFLAGELSKQSLDSYPRLPNILDLKELRHLGLHSGRVTDASVFLAILDAKELRELTLERCEVTDKSISAILDELDIHHFAITLCTRVSGPQLELVKEKMKNRDLTIDYMKNRDRLYD